MMRYMFVVAHPDDEVLGAGAFIHRCIQRKDEVAVVIMNATYEKTRANMMEDLIESHRRLGIGYRALFDFENMNFHKEDQRKMVESIEEQIATFKPDIIFTHWPHDLHNDHRITSICTQQAARYGQRHFYHHKVDALYFMEVLSSTGWSSETFKPDTYVEVTEVDLEAKIKALQVYENVLRPLPHPRCEDVIMSLAQLRGSEIGHYFSEAFQTCWRENV